MNPNIEILKMYITYKLDHIFKKLKLHYSSKYKLEDATGNYFSMKVEILHALFPSEVTVSFS